MPVRGSHVEPSILYSHVASVSKSDTSTDWLLVRRSKAFSPVSSVSKRLGAFTVVSKVNVNAELVAVFPAASFCSTITDFAPSSVSVKLSLLPVIQVIPASRL